MDNFEKINVSKQNMDKLLNRLMEEHSWLCNTFFQDLDKIVFEYFDKIVYTNWLRIHKVMIGSIIDTSKYSEYYIFDKRGLKQYIKALKNMSKFISLNSIVTKIGGYLDNGQTNPSILKGIRGACESLAKYLNRYINPEPIVGKENK